MKAANLKKILIDKSLIIVLIIMILGIIAIESSFLQWRVFTDIITQSAVKMICAIGTDVSVTVRWNGPVWRTSGRTGSRTGGIHVSDG